MKKKITTFLLSLTLCVGITACSFLPQTSGAGTSLSSSNLDIVEGSEEESTLSSRVESYEYSSVEGEETEVADLSVHFLELGNATSGDCTLIKTGNTEVLIDAGSTTGSAKTIVPYIQKYCTDGILEYVIATHGDQDHIAAFVGSSTYNGVFDSFVCETIIDFPKTTKSTDIYKDYVAKRGAEVALGATHYTALQCYNQTDGAKRSYTLGEGITMNFLYQKYYVESTSNENNYSVCTLISQGKDNHYLFTGDLESSGEVSLVANNTLPKCKLYKAGHHGSSTSSTSALISVIQPEIVVACCCASDKHDFPHQEFINNVAPYTDKVYVPAMKSGSSYALMNGNIVVNSVKGQITVSCSNNDTLLKDTAWFKENRTMPTAWS